MPEAIDYGRLLQEVPGVLQEYNEESTRDKKSIKYLKQLGIDNAEEYAAYWYNNMGGSQMYSQAPITPTTPPPQTGATNPTVTDPYTPPTTPNGGQTTPDVITNPPPTNTSTGQPTGTGSGAAVTPGGNRDVAFNQALFNARLQLINQGYNPDQFMGEIGGYLTDIYNIIPTTDSNAGAYFDPNFVTNFIGGKNAGAQRQARNFVSQSLKKPNLDYTALDATISKLLEGGLKEGQDYLDRGRTRGQFNDVGYNAGVGKLAEAKAKASAKLKGYATDIYGKYNTQFDDIYSRANTAANGATFDAPFDLTPFAGEFDRLSSRVNGAGLEGELLSQVGDQPLIDLASLRTSIGKGQGAVNLKDLDVLEGLDRRKRVSDQGRGIGSQGTF